MVYLPMSYVYAKRATAQETPLIADIRWGGGPRCLGVGVVCIYEGCWVSGLGLGCCSHPLPPTQTTQTTQQQAWAVPRCLHRHWLECSAQSDCQGGPLLPTPPGAGARWMAGDGACDH